MRVDIEAVRSTQRTSCMMHTEPDLLDLQSHCAACCADMHHGAPNSNRVDVEAGCVLQAHPRANERLYQLRISAGHVSRRIWFQCRHRTLCASLGPVINKANAMDITTSHETLH